MANADSFFCIGFTHKVCQDYAANGFLETRTTSRLISEIKPFAAVSDGCSSAPETDFGARFLVKAFIDEAKKSQSDPEGEPRDAILRKLLMITADGWARQLRLPKECLAATLLTVVLEEKQFVAKINGDGVVVARKRTGELVVRSYEFPSGAPYYLYYDQGAGDKQLYAQQFGTKLVEKKAEIQGNEIIDLGETRLDDQWDQTIEVNFDRGDYDMVAILSDGIHSFLRNEVTETSLQKVNVPFTEIIKELLQFKGLQGEFVQRRLSKGLKDLAGRGITHYDDLSVGAVADRETT